MTSNDLKNIFLMPCGAAKIKEHLQKTVLHLVKQGIIFPTVSEETRVELEAIFGGKDIAVWGSNDGRNNRVFFNKMQPGDYILFSVGQEVRVVGQIVHKTISPELSKVLWPGDDKRVFSLIYFIDKIVKVEKPLAKVFAALGYKENYVMQGLTSVSSDRLKAFYEKHQDILSLLSDAQAEDELVRL